MSRPLLYGGKQRYVITVMWLSGFSVGAIASDMPRQGFAPMNKEAVNKVVMKCFQQLAYPPRGSMTLAERQERLTALRESPYNDGTLPDRLFEVQR